MTTVRHKTPISRTLGVALAPLCVAGATSAVHAQTFAAPFAGSYSFVSLGTPSGVAPSFGGLTLSASNQSTLLIGASANGSGATVDSIGLTRTLVNGKNRITGFTGTASVVSTAPGITSGGIDGGLAYGPGNVLFYSSYNDNSLGEIKSGGTTPAKQVSLTSLGVASSTGGLQFVPTSLPNAGKLWVTSYSGGDLYEASITADGTGTYNIGSFTDLGSLGGGPEGIVFVPAGSPGFSSNSILVSQYGNGQIEAYTLDASGHPIVSSAQPFLTGLSNVEGGTIDTSTGDFLFSTFGGGNQVIAVRGFASAATPEPAAASLLLGALPVIGGIFLRRRTL